MCISTVETLRMSESKGQHTITIEKAHYTKESYTKCTAQINRIGQSE